MTYIELLLGFLKVGCFSFGGAYGAIPLIRDVVMSYGWMTEEELTYMIAVSESTPGPIMVNLATFVGNTQGGIIGAIIATLAVVLPSFLIILLVSAVMKKLLKNKYVQAALRGLKPCIVGLVMATGVFMVITHCIALSSGFAVDWKALFLTVFLTLVLYLSKPLFKKKISPILLIVISTVLGIVGYAL